MPHSKDNLPHLPSAGDRDFDQDDDVLSHPDLAEELYQMTVFGQAAAPDRGEVVYPAAILDDFTFPMSPHVPQPTPAGSGFDGAAVAEDAHAVQVVVTDA